MILFVMTCLGSQLLPAQNDSYSYSEITMLTNLYSEIQSTPSRSVCYPWASTMRLVNIKENNNTMTDLLSYENLWVALQETCLKNQRTSTQLEVSLDKRGKIISISRNGAMMDLTPHTKLTKTKFSKHRSKDGKVINIYTSVG